MRWAFVLENTYLSIPSQVFMTVTHFSNDLTLGCDICAGWVCIEKTARMSENTLDEDGET